MRSRFIAVFVLGLLSLPAGFRVWAAGPATVQVKETQVRERPSFTGKAGTVLAYGTLVRVLEEQGPWSRVTADKPKASGWVHGSALTRKTLDLKAGAAGRTGASSSEVALAGKGFNAEVEAEYKKGAGLDYSLVDKMETYRVTPAEAQAFLSEGGINPQGGPL